MTWSGVFSLLTGSLTSELYLLALPPDYAAEYEPPLSAAGELLIRLSNDIGSLDVPEIARKLDELKGVDIRLFRAHLTEFEKIILVETPTAITKTRESVKRYVFNAARSGVKLLQEADLLGPRSVLVDLYATASEATAILRHKLKSAEFALQQMMFSSLYYVPGEPLGIFFIIRDIMNAIRTCSLQIKLLTHMLDYPYASEAYKRALFVPSEIETEPFIKLLLAASVWMLHNPYRSFFLGPRTILDRAAKFYGVEEILRDHTHPPYSDWLPLYMFDCEPVTDEASVEVSNEAARLAARDIDESVALVVGEAEGNSVRRALMRIHDLHDRHGVKVERYTRQRTTEYVTHVMNLSDSIQLFCLNVLENFQSLYSLSESYFGFSLYMGKASYFRLLGRKQQSSVVLQFLSELPNCEGCELLGCIMKPVRSLVSSYEIILPPIDQGQEHEAVRAHLSLEQENFDDSPEAFLERGAVLIPEPVVMPVAEFPAHDDLVVTEEVEHIQVAEPFLVQII